MKRLCDVKLVMVLSGEIVAVTAGDKRQRLTCKWLPRGFVLIYR